MAVAQQHEGRNGEAQADGTGVDAALEVVPHPLVGQVTAEDDADERRGGDGDCGERTGTFHGYAQVVGEQRRQPVLRCPSRKAGNGEEEEDDPERPVGQYDAEALQQSARPGLLILRGGLRGVAGLLMQQGYQHQRVGYSDDTEPVEGGLPREHGGHHGPEAAYGLTHVDTRHVNADGQ